jgi:predicted TIM-barrel fold metal-dependent hydrolase
MRDICDCHMHILDHRYPLWSGAVLNPPDALVPGYTAVRSRIGIAKCVVAAPSIYGADNRCTRDAMHSLGIPAKGTAVLTKDATADDVAALARAGFVAARFNCVQGGPWTLDDVAPIARLVADFGWHVQVYARPKQIVEMAPILHSLPTPIVFEHMSRIRDPRGEDAQAFATILKLADRGAAWVKLSAPYIEPDRKDGAGDRFANTVAAFAQAMPERAVWGSDWPHATERQQPDTVRIFEDFCSFVGSRKALDAILRDNPKRLYGFD